MNRLIAGRHTTAELPEVADWPLAEPFRIGDVTLPNRVVQPPLAGIANWAFRAQSRRFGVGLAVSEMVSAYGIAYDNDRTRAMLDTSHDEGPVAIQLFGADPGVMADAARAAADAGASIIDINMGCPVKKVCKTGAGAALLSDPERGAAVVRAIANAVDVPVTVKMRRGMTPATADPVSAARRFEDAGAAAIFFHPRTAADEYDGSADHSHTADVAAAVSVPVIASGDIGSAAEAMRVFEQAGVAAIAIGRPAFGNPWLYDDVAAGRMSEPPALVDVVDEVRRFAADVAEALGEHRACAYMRKFYPWYLTGHPVTAEEREGLLTAPALDAALGRLDDIVGRLRLKPAASVDYLTAPSPTRTTH